MVKQYRYREVTYALEQKLDIPFGSGSERTGWFYHEGRKVLRITIPHVHSGTFPVGTLNGIRKQTLLSWGEFDELIGCSMSSSGYIESLRSKGQI